MTSSGKASVLNISNCCFNGDELDEVHITQKVAQGIRENTVSNGDMLALALQRSDMKRKRNKVSINYFLSYFISN